MTTSTCTGVHRAESHHGSTAFIIIPRKVFDSCPAKIAELVLQPCSWALLLLFQRSGTAFAMVEHRLLLVTILALSIVEATLSSNDSDVTPAPLSGCQVCAASGDCSHAYLDAPGQFCGNWLDRASQRQRCCCPREATCAVSNYACNCKTSKTKTPTSASTRSSTSSSSRASWGAILGSVLLLFAASAVLWCLCPCCRANKYAALSQSMTPVVVQAPAYAPTYAHTYTPGYPSGPVYGGPAYSNGGMGAGSSAMLGGVAGLFGGILVGQALSNSGEHHGGSDACYTDNGGEEFGGDF